ncbi:uncharacterized protein FOMMEDRAFT_152418 [Fomitiporia mediterranea MF3/22]|uniref:uncharacterized protein n=1 Tax=Fomitiporia mediterranea (strain MF3/22) TaxID=694068 RepID=UPI0004407295|nr:uncharacterized protein FOMMEDRAFT_152418 [Fomitiporia mediterranea MF3/22]EJD07067.1 hypothetical protein FOMMEDRAFT_152418 [Fomitiporia mediterranea MF3/22]
MPESASLIEDKNVMKLMEELVYLAHSNDVDDDEEIGIRSFLSRYPEKSGADREVAAKYLEKNQEVSELVSTYIQVERSLSKDKKKKDKLDPLKALDHKKREASGYSSFYDKYKSDQVLASYVLECKRIRRHLHDRFGISIPNDHVIGSSELERLAMLPFMNVYLPWLRCDENSGNCDTHCGGAGRNTRVRHSSANIRLRPE